MVQKVRELVTQLLRPDMRYVFFKYAIAGGTSASVTLGILYVLTQWFGVWYLFSATVGYLVGFFVSFTLQKFWTFQNSNTDKIFSQAFLYFIILVGNLGLNALALYILVDIFHFWYIFAEFIVLLFIAVESFFLYRLVFKKCAKTS